MDCRSWWQAMRLKAMGFKFFFRSITTLLCYMPNEVLSETLINNINWRSSRGSRAHYNPFISMATSVGFFFTLRLSQTGRCVKFKLCHLLAILHWESHVIFDTIFFICKMKEQNQDPFSSGNALTSSKLGNMITVI